MPASIDRPTELALPPAHYGLLQDFTQEIEQSTEAGQIAVHLLPDNSDSFLWRLMLIDAAQQSLDLQYFLWDDDYAGRLLLQRVLAAADRGVRVRLLLDDIMLPLSHKTTAALDQHENISVRIYNPVVNRRTLTGTAFRYAMNQPRLNHRMHNKLFLVDGLISIVGSRNIGNNYFGLNQGYNFRDLDVVAVGSVIEDMMYSFDHYWNSRYAVESSQLYRSSRSRHLTNLRSQYDNYIEHHSLTSSIKLPESPRQWLHESSYIFHSAEAQYIYDHPADRTSRHVFDALLPFLKTVENTLTIVTPYFLPNDRKQEFLRSILRDDITIELLVPSLASINHTIVHSHYSPMRNALLDMGVNIYEYQHQPTGLGREYADSPYVEADFISMHMKALVVDNNKAYIGSLNLNHRSLYTDTENGLLLTSVAAVGDVRDIVNAMIQPSESWTLARNGSRILWIAGDEKSKTQPTRTLLQHIPYFWGTMLPIRHFL